MMEPLSLNRLYFNYLHADCAERGDLTNLALGNNQMRLIHSHAVLDGSGKEVGLGRIGR